jgi:hypothetical protein
MFEGGITRKTPKVVIDAITKRYGAGHTLSLMVVNKNIKNIITEKSVTYLWSWDFDEIKVAKEKGAQVGFKKWWKKNGLKLSLTYSGTYLAGKMFTMTAANIKVTCPFPSPLARGAGPRK